MKVSRFYKYIAAWAVTHEEMSQLREMGFWDSPRPGTYGANYSEDLVKELAKLGAVLDDSLSLAVRTAEHWDSVEPLVLPSKRESMKHQLVANRLLVMNNSFLLAYEQGCGKSKPVVDVSANMIHLGVADRVLILTDATVVQAWSEGHIPADCFYDYKAVALLGTAERRRKLIRKAVQEDIKYLVINYDGLKTVIEDLIASGLLTYNSILVLDESQRVKNYDTGRFRTVKKLIDETGIIRRWLLSGTPTSQNPLDIFGQAALINPIFFGEPRFPAHNDFVLTYSEPDKYGRVKGYKNMEEYMYRLHSFCHRLTKAETLTLPDKVYETIELELPSQVREVYRDLVAHARIKLPKAPVPLIDGLEKGAQLAKALQVVNNWTYLETLNERGGVDRTVKVLFPDLPNPKLDFIRQTIQDTYAPCVVWFSHEADKVLIEQYFRKHEISFVAIDGSVPVHKRYGLSQQFQTGQVDLFLGHPGAAGTGIDLYRAKYVFYYNNTHKVQDREQSEDRCHRKGLRHPVTYYDLVYKGTIEVSMLKKLKDKQEISAITIDRNLTSEQAHAMLMGGVVEDGEKAKLE